jgi:hypothetical protein
VLDVEKDAIEKSIKTAATCTPKTANLKIFLS